MDAALRQGIYWRMLTQGDRDDLDGAVEIVRGKGYSAPYYFLFGDGRATIPYWDRATRPMPELIGPPADLLRMARDLPTLTAPRATEG